MNDLIKASLWRVVRGKLFWIATGGVLLVSAVTVFDSIRLEMLCGESWNLERSYYNLLPYMGILLGVVIPIFTGSEFKDRAVRNKLLAGYTKGQVYKANLLVAAVWTTAFQLAWATGGLVGIAHFGLWEEGIVVWLGKCLCAWLAAIVLATFFNGIVHVTASKTLSLVLCVVCAFAMINIGGHLCRACLEEKVETAATTYTEEGYMVFQEEKPNPDYIDGGEKLACKICSYVIPAGQQIWLKEGGWSNNNLWLMYAISIALTAALSFGAGAVFARRKLRI